VNALIVARTGPNVKCALQTPMALKRVERPVVRDSVERFGVPADGQIELRQTVVG